MRVAIGTESELPEPLIEAYARSSGQRLSFRLMTDASTGRDLTGFAARVFFWYQDAYAHAVGAALVDEANGVVIYDLCGDEFPRIGVVYAQPSVMSPDFFEHSGEVVAIRVLPPSVPGDSKVDSPRSTSGSGLLANDRIDLVMPAVCRIELDTSTGKSEVVSAEPGIAGAYTFFEQSDPGQKWGDLFRTVATRLRLPWDTRTLLAMTTVLSQDAWKRKPPAEHQPYVAGSILKERRRLAIRKEIKGRKRRGRESLWGDLLASTRHGRQIAESVSYDPLQQEAEERDWGARIERCLEVLAQIDDWNPKQTQLMAGLERQASADESISPAEVGRLLGWSHEETMSTWQSLQRKALRAYDFRLSGEEEEK